MRGQLFTHTSVLIIVRAITWAFSSNSNKPKESEVKQIWSVVITPRYSDSTSKSAKVPLLSLVQWIFWYLWLELDQSTYLWSHKSEILARNRWCISSLYNADVMTSALYETSIFCLFLLPASTLGNVSMVFSLFLGTAYVLLCINGITNAGHQLVGYPNISAELLKICKNSKSSDRALMFKYQYRTQRRNPVSTSTLNNLLKIPSSRKKVT